MAAWRSPPTCVVSQTSAPWRVASIAASGLPSRAQHTLRRPCVHTSSSGPGTGSPKSAGPAERQAREVEPGEVSWLRDGAAREPGPGPGAPAQVDAEGRGNRISARSRWPVALSAWPGGAPAAGPPDQLNPDAEVARGRDGRSKWLRECRFRRLAGPRTGMLDEQPGPRGDGCGREVRLRALVPARAVFAPGG